MTGSIRQHVLFTEDTFHASYLIQRWQREFPGETGRILVRSKAPGEHLQAARQRFLREHAGRRGLPGAARATWQSLYPTAGPADYAMIELFGVPAAGPAAGTPPVYLGDRANAEPVRAWFDSQLAGRPEVFLHVFLDRILAPWWITGVAGRIVNAHSAVLPIARGSNAIEQVAALQDGIRFARAAGATLHYVDTGVDTGEVIEIRRLPDPFGFDSIWQCKAACFATAFDLLVDNARRLSKSTDLPTASPQHGGERWPDFRRADFDTACQRRAELGYHRLKYLDAEITRSAGYSVADSATA